MSLLIQIILPTDLLTFADALGLATVAYTPVLDRSITFEHLFREAQQNNEADKFLEKFESNHTPTHDIHLDMEYLNSKHVYAFVKFRH